MSGCDKPVNANKWPSQQVWLNTYTHNSASISPELIIDSGIPVGVASIDLSVLKARGFGVIDGWYELFDLKGLSQGQIKIVAKYDPLENSLEKESRKNF